jgi:glycosyltransferase involved in cell wall biosynthesis
MKNQNLPKISIITPSYNQGQFLEETIQSVISQNYPNLEYIIIDGGSTDNSVEIIKKYEQFLSYWISEPDRGQTDAINKGLKKSTGEIWSYLNSDDLLYPNALYRVAELFQSGIDWIGGVSETFDSQGIIGSVTPSKNTRQIDYLQPWNRKVQYVFPCSNVCFMSRKILEKCGLFDSAYEYSMDIEYCVRAVFQGGFEPYLIPDVLGGWRWHLASKTFKKGLAYGFRKDEVQIAQKYINYLSLEESQILEREIKIQQLWLVIRKAIFDAKQGKNKQSLLALLSQINKYPKLLQFRPWYGAVKQIVVNYLLAKYQTL